MGYKINMKNWLEQVIFSSRWLLIPFYLGLFVTMLVYTSVYLKEIWHLIGTMGVLEKDNILLITLELVDIVMIANLVKMIITGSYHSFVSKDHGVDGESVSSGMLKVKMSTSLIGVSSIHLLQAFINAEHVTIEVLEKQVGIHVVFLIGALVLSVIDYLHSKSESLHHK